MRKLLITGSDGFTGRHLKDFATILGYNVYSLNSNILDKQSIKDEIFDILPDYVIHLAAISSVTHGNISELYNVNLIGSLNLLESLKELEKKPKKVLMASSANVYGNSLREVVDENICPSPINHYAISKLSMEYMALEFRSHLPILISRPFNYTGPGHDTRFVIPKIISSFKNKEKLIILGNMNIYREFNDVRFICDSYLKLLDVDVTGEIFNICTGNSYSLQNVIDIAKSLTGHEIETKTSQDFVRPNEVHKLAGCCRKLKSTIKYSNEYSLNDTIEWMLLN